jgi:hypothetical protein
MLDRAIGIAGLAGSIVGLVVPIIFPKIDKRIALGGIVVGIFLLGVALALALTGGNAQTVQMQPVQYAQTSINGNCNAVGNGNSVCNGPQKLQFSEEIGQALLQRMPEKKPVALTAVGSQTDIKIGMRFAQFLRQNGYIVTVAIVGMMAPPPDHKIAVGVTPDHYNVLIAPDAE